MASTTIYPYGTEGHTPANLGIINDVYTGGADKALSAEQGKSINQQINDFSVVNLSLISETQAFIATSTGTWTVGYDTWKCKFIPAQAGATYVIKANSSYQTFVAVLQDNSYSSGTEPHYASGYTNVRVPAGGYYQVTIPETDSYLYVATTSNGNDATPESVSIVISKFGKYDEVIEDLYGEEYEVDEVFNFNGAPLYNISMDADKFYYYSTTKVYKAYCIPIPEGAEQVTITPNSSANVPLCITKVQVPVGTWTTSQMATSYMATGCEGYIPTSPSSYRMTLLRADGTATIKLSSNAKFIYIQKNYGDTSINCTPTNMTFSGTGRRNGRLDNVNQDSSGVFNGISFVEGNLDIQGKLVPDETHVVSNLVPANSGYFLRVNSNFKIERVVLFDNKGNCVNYEYFVPITGQVNKTSHFGRIAGPGGYSVRFIVEKQSGNVNAEDNIVSDFVLFNDPRLHRFFPENNKFQLFQERIKALTKVTWKAISRVPSPMIYKETYFDPGTVNVGIPYSELGEHSKYVGMNVSLRTFITSLLNPRSVMYTEVVSGEAPSSKYGISYHNYENAAGSYYGTVCSGLTAYALALPEILTSGLYGEGVISGETSIAKGDQNNKYYIKQGNSWVTCSAEDIVELVQPMDVIKSPGHVSTISDIYLDEYGNRKFIVWCEEGRAEVTVAKQRPLPISSFISKLDGFTSDPEGWTLLRYTNWDNLTPVQDDRDSVPMEWYECPKDIKIDPDICTYTGDYVVFQIGDPNDTANNNKAFLNIHRNGNKYDTLQIFAEDADPTNDSPVQSVNISANSGTFIYNSTDIYEDDAADKDDWIILDLKQLSTPLTHGKYKARVIKSGTSTESGFTHFQMVDVNFTITGTSLSDMVCNYSSEEATPYYMRRERLDGLGADKKQRVIPEGESSSTAPRNWGINSTYKFIKVFFKADYGTAVKRIDAYSQFNS